MSHQPTSALASKGLEWQNWIISNLARGCIPATLLQRMIDKQWPEDLARRALEEGQAQLAKPPASRPCITAASLKACTDARPRQLLSLAKPSIVLLDALLSHDECDALVQLARDKGIKPSRVVDRDDGNRVPHDGRSSSGSYFTRAELPLLARIEQRLASITQWPASHAEGIQILFYQPGQEYRPHFDWFDPAQAGSAKHLQRGGQRVGTFVLYLSDVAQGGGTIFPKLGLDVLPSKGAGVFFANVNEHGNPDPDTLHGGAPVIEGTKIIATYWQRETVYHRPHS
ncbi:MAG: 2OG-Fe(II) oxygenase [Methylococcales bacterium]|nr:2OG-Fe(II) oxygenase [Methylococcales bacterium]